MANALEKLRLRERRDSVSGDSVEESTKRKREMIGDEAAEIFKRSCKVGRSPGEKRWKEEMRGMMKELREELRGEVREGMKGVSAELNRVTEVQKETLREEMEKIKNEWRDRERIWEKEREEFRERIEEIERKLEGVIGK